MNDKLHIVQIDKALLVALWPYLSPLLEKGAQGAAEEEVQKALEDVFQDRARVWAVIDHGEPLAAFLTSVVDDNGNSALDVYGLGGRGITHWGKALTDRMVEYARVNECKRVLFKGRKALQRAYEGIKVIGTEGPGVYIYERSL